MLKAGGCENSVRNTRCPTPNSRPAAIWRASAGWRWIVVKAQGQGCAPGVWASRSAATAGLLCLQQAPALPASGRPQSRPRAG